MIRLQACDEGVVVPVRAQPSGSQNKIQGLHDGALRVSVIAAPDKGKANVAIVKLLSESLNVAKSSIELRSGATSREKRFLVRGIEPDSLLAQIEAWVGRSS